MTQAQKVLPLGVHLPRTIAEVTQIFEQQVRAGRLEGYHPVPTGFAELDEILGGGFLSHCLLLVGGRQNVGKTIWILQAARNVALSGTAAVVVEYEHDEVHMLHRLLCMESYLSADDGVPPVGLTEIREAVLSAVEQGERENLHAILSRLPGARRAWQTMVGYLDRLLLAKAHPVRTTLDVIRTYAVWLIENHGHGVIFVDYLQKVVPALDLRDLPKERRATLVVYGLKDIAFETGIPIVAVSALDIEGLKRGEARVDDLAGGEATKYEPDAILMLLPGRDDPARIHFLVAKNRAGPAGVGVTHRRIGRHFVFHPEPEEDKR